MAADMNLLPLVSLCTIIVFYYLIPQRKKLWNLSLLFLFFGLSGFELSAHKLRHVYLTCTEDATSSITVNIHGIQTSSELIVYYDTKPCLGQIFDYGKETKVMGKKIEELPDFRRIYHAKLTDLKPNTLYYFSIGDRYKTISQEFAFRTLPQDSPILLIEGGDFENTESAQLLAKKAASLSPHAVLLGGDYPSCATHKLDYQQWDKWLDTYAKTMKTKEGLLIPLVAAVGNHEVSGGFGKTPKDIPFYLDYLFPNTYFSLSLGPDRHLFVLDSGHAASHEGSQRAWLEDELKNVSHKKIKMAIYHVPLYPSIRFYEKNIFYYLTHGCLELFKKKSNADKLFSKESALGRKAWLPLFDQYHMTVAFEHHDHTLKRTKLLKENRVDDQGTLYLGDGSFGSECQHHPIQTFFHSYFAKVLGKEHFFWAVLIQKDHISYAAVNAEGKILDRFIQKL